MTESHSRIPIFDGHNDTLLDILEKDRDFYSRSDDGHLDYVRAREGGFIGGFFACWVPSPTGSYGETGQALAAKYTPGVSSAALENEWGGPSLAFAQQFTNAMIAQLMNLEAGGGPALKDLTTTDDASVVDDPLTVVHFAEDLAENIENDDFSAILHFEGAEAIDENFYALEVYHAAGLRSLGPVWSRQNIFATGVPIQPGSPDVGDGLTDLGRELVIACNLLGIMLDVSHLNEKGFWDLAATTTAPIVATHSCAWAIAPHARNLTDKQLDAIRDSNGLVGLNFAVPFLSPDGSRDPNLPLSVMADHIDHLVDHLGIDGVALGSDFDGAGLPADLSDVSKLPNLIAVLRDRGYDDDALQRIGYRNWLRVLHETWGM